MNFGETLAYWYLRLNGFFPLTNFVLHRAEECENNDRDADCDLLAVRFPYVFEEVGGQRDDWDSKRFTEWGIKLEERVVGLIVEVKTGKVEWNDLRAFDRKRLVYGVRRLGVVPQQAVDSVVDALETKATYAGDGNWPISIAKLLVTSRGLPRSFERTACQMPFLWMALDEVEQFVRARMKKYERQKVAARMFFNSELIQYLAWRSPRNDEAGTECQARKRGN